MKFKLQSFLSKAIRVMIILFSTLVMLIIVIFVILWILSPGNSKPFLDENGKILVNSISEKIYVDINGVKQGMFIKGKDISKPVLLYVHGGMPFYFLTQTYPTGLEGDFVIVWWEQRGSGMSYDRDISTKPVTSEDLVADLLSVTNYLRQRFNQEKIYLMGHSGGTFIGIKAASKAPEQYHAYIGISQMSNQLKSEKLAYEYMLEQYKINGNRKMVEKLKAAPVTLTDIPKKYLTIRDEAMHTLGIGTMRNMNSVITGIFFPSLSFREYTLKEKINLWRAKAASGVSIIWDEILLTDLSKEVTELHIPVYFFVGIYDYTCSYSEAKSYFDKLKAPVKGFYTFDESAHSPIFEEPEKAHRIFRQDVLAGLIKLADKNE